MSLMDARHEKRFDKRLVERFLRRGVITIESLNEHMEALEDCAALVYNAEDASSHMIDDDDDDDMFEDDDMDEEED